MADILTLAEAKTYLGIDNTDKDAILTPMVAAVNASIASWTESAFGAEVVVTNELHDARRQDIFIPDGFPLVSVQQIVTGVDSAGAGGTVLDPEDYSHDSVEVRILRSLVPQARSYVRIDYTYGYADVPPQVKMAAQLGVEGFYRMRERKSVGISSKSKEGESVSYGGGAWNSQAGLPREAVSLLESFRRIDFGSTKASMATRNT